ncbi:MAG: hypothetical protein LBQ59_01950 [Candidatus Peribacteria bacterium]|jgi:hypothetical protein|nr:hypothetical protein [Candidatus Peribacteria bacterium]
MKIKKKLLFLLTLFFYLGINIARAESVDLEGGSNNKFTAIKKNNYYFPYIDGFLLGEYKIGFMDRKNVNLYGEKDKTIGYFDIRTSFDINFNDNFSLSNSYRIKPLMKRDYKGDYKSNDFYAREGYLEKDMYFDKYDIITEELYFNFFAPDLKFGIGKFNPAFGLAYSYDKYNGIIGSNYFASEYFVKETIGMFVKINLPSFILNFSTFYRDTSFLSDSIFGRRDKLRSGSLVGSDEKLNNFALSGEFVLEDLKLNLAFRRMSAGNRDQRAEKSFLIGLEKVYEYASGTIFTPFIEYDYTKNYEGSHRDVHYITVNAPILYENWNFLVGASSKYDRDSYVDKNKFSYLTQVNVGYKFNHGIMFDVSRVMGKEYKNTTLNNKKTVEDLDSWNIRLSYILDFQEDK